MQEGAYGTVLGEAWAAKGPEEDPQQALMH